MSDKIKAPSVNKTVKPIVEKMIAEADQLRIAVSKGEAGETLIDCGDKVPGGLEAGRRMAEVCLGGLGTVSLEVADTESPFAFNVTVHSSQPVIACLGSQYAGWSLSAKKDDGKTYYVLGSGPGRALGSSEPLFKELGYRDTADEGFFVLEADAPPPASLVKEVAEACKVKPENLTFLYAPTSSIAGMVQIIGRSLEVALHKAHELHFPLENIVDGIASAPLAPPAPDFVQAMGRTNDAIIYGGRVQLYVNGDEKAAEELAEKLPSSASKDYGQPFAEIFSAVKGDFYAIDKMLFSPAQAMVSALESGKSFQAGGIDNVLLNRCFYK
ncbi:Methenyltetrahydromethanopterin cyclohydrolase [Methyloligella halotolerans]|uniref:Methenyltetrahydromethanopterin cyclohydrolase n=1 Tax=Methyloligella halotolerans TaxID=1177755 RepID=A0A1E2S2Y0_9HYPH|nr:methenyltetrahydromethanopterin cyclohydrolase [Methyloligella halotolerans]ODA68791.1 Methenyltetrahydromethanopterin cyclohydrolase [Methyloligella halotolerans]